MTTVPEQPSLSPDARRCVYVLRTSDTEEDRVVRRLWMVDTAGGNGPRQLTHGDADTDPAWSPDGSRIAFRRGQELWLLPADGGEPEPVAQIAGAPVWSPDGTRIAFTAPVGETGEQEPIVVDGLAYQADGAGLLRGRRNHVHVLDVATGQVRRMGGGDGHAGRPAWSPDSASLAYAAGTSVHAPVYVADASSAETREVGLADGIAGTVTWTADGKALLVVGAPSPIGHARLLHLPLQGEATDLTATLDRNVMAGGPGYPGAVPQLADEGKTVLFCVRDRGCTHLYSVPVGGGEARPVVSGAGHVVSGVSVAGGTAAVVLATPDSFGEIATVDLATGERTVHTRHSAAVGPFPRVEREFTISDGTVVQAWLVRDPSLDGPGPLLLDVHGGPHNAWNGAADEVHPYHQQLAALGWTVLLVNPRASDGYGERFFTATVGAWGEADAKDFLEPIDTLVAEGIADPARLAVTGYSYGGYMTCYLTGRDRRFAAAVAGGVVSDPVSMAGTSDEGHLLAEFEFGGQPWSDAERYARLSPFARVGEVTTPTLVLHGADDVRCPIGQAQQWHAALHERGVPTQLVLYPGASHLFILDGKPSHRADYSSRVVDWVQRHANGAKPRIDAAHWQRRLAELAQRHGVPGAVLGILHGDEQIELAYGVLNKDTGVEVTTDSLFQIGSITKVWTATVAMLLADEGKLDLDRPIADVLPELRLSNPDVAAQVTMRHLLTHTSGIDGDVFTDTGRGDDCLEKYVAALSNVAQNHPLGATWSYCNSGFSLAGRIIEKLTGGTWDAAMRERLFTPLGLRRTITLPEEALLHRTAVGHVEVGDELVRAPVWMLPRPLGPAGLISATAADVLAFARLHLTGGKTADGTQLLSPQSAAAMADLQAELPDKHTLGDSWGLGWIRDGWDGRRLIGHDGNTIGQAAFLRLLPAEGLAVTMLTNGGRTRDLYQELYREIFAELAGVQMPQPLRPPAEPVTVDIAPHVGTYKRASVILEVLDGEDGPALRTTLTGELAALTPEPVTTYPMVPIDDNLFVVREPQAQTWTPVTFYQLPTGEKYVHFGVRATPKVS